MSDLVIELDIDGYPTDDCLKSIKSFSDCQRWEHLLEQVQPLFADYGRCEKREDGVWIVETGGWSGCEDVIAALNGNFYFWPVCWLLSTCGGYYEFGRRGNGSSLHDIRRAAKNALTFIESLDVGDGVCAEVKELRAALGEEGRI